MRSFALSGILCAVLAVGPACRAYDFSGLIFYEYSHDATKGGTEDGRFEVGRAYLTLSESPTENVSYKLQLDVGRAGSDTGDMALEAYLKTASASWKTDWGTFIFGMQGMNMFKVQESTFGNRFLSKALMDEHKFSSSADMGLGYTNRFGELFSGSVLVTNGEGYKKPESDKYKKISLQVLAGEAALSKHTGWNAGVVYSMEPISKDDSRTVMGLFGGYALEEGRVGIEFDTKTTTGVTDITEQIIGFYGVWKLPLSLPMELLAQLDLMDPDTNTDKDGETGLVLGLKLNPAKGLVIAPNIRTISYEADGVETDTWYRVNFEFKI